MEIKAEPTTETVDLRAGRGRLWRARTHSGAEFFLVVRCVAIPAGTDMSEFSGIEYTGDDAGIDDMNLGRVAKDIEILDVVRINRAIHASTRGLVAGERPLNEIFMLHMDRAEIELVFGFVSTLYAVELAGTLKPASAIVFTDEGQRPLRDWLSELGGRGVSKHIGQFVEKRGLEAFRDLTNKFLRLLGRTELR